ncbi:MAG: hypothetical protein CL933_06265 [Deltaproteobacteria bacterium]|nr:hypothetical protein [Deltaproteobacteria bacterium]
MPRAEMVRAVLLRVSLLPFLVTAPAGATIYPVTGWGDDLDGQASPPVSVDGTSGTASAIAAEGTHSRAIQTVPEPSSVLQLIRGGALPSTLQRRRRSTRANPSRGSPLGFDMTSMLGRSARAGPFEPTCQNA